MGSGCGGGERGGGRERLSEPTGAKGIVMGGVVMKVKGAVECSCSGGEVAMVGPWHAPTRTTLS